MKFKGSTFVTTTAKVSYKVPKDVEGNGFLYDLLADLEDDIVTNALFTDYVENDHNGDEHTFDLVLMRYKVKPDPKDSEYEYVIETPKMANYDHGQEMTTIEVTVWSQTMRMS